MSMNIGTLALKAGSCPSADVRLDARPYIEDVELLVSQGGISNEENQKLHV